MLRRMFCTCALFFHMTGLYCQDNCPCCTENHRAFDFWVGEWEVRNTGDSLVGTNTIRKLETNCVLQENWKSATTNSTGTSTNFYNSTTGQWEQLWVDNSGFHLKLKGNRKDNQMILSSDEYIGSDGKGTIHRITWTANEDGTVRQLWETLTNDEVTSIAFDGLYRKIKR